MKIYTIVFTDCLTRASILDYVDQAFVRFINTCGKPSLCISDADSSFKAISRDYKLADVEWINKFDKSKELQELKNEFNIEFWFNTPNFPELQSLVERKTNPLFIPC